MTIKIVEIRDSGVADKERLVLNVTQNDDVGRYIVFHVREIDANTFNSRVLRTFWFPDKQVRAGDLIALYTKRGTDSERINKDKSTSHFFYWGLEEPIWGNSESTAVLVRAEWQVAHRATEQQTNLPIQGVARERAE